MKRAFALFWHGLTALLAGMASWFTVILGMKDESKYGKFLRRTVGTCFALLMIMLVVAAGGDFCNYAYRRLALSQNFGDEYWDQRQISPS
ncbi:MAG: WG repeat-containing protein, partial [Alloprevotella sp.]